MAQHPVPYHALDYRGTDISVGQVVSFYDETLGGLRTGEVKMIAHEQIVIGGEEGKDVPLTLVKGNLKFPDGPRGHGRVRYATVVVLPEEYR